MSARCQQSDHRRHIPWRR